MLEDTDDEETWGTEIAILPPANTANDTDGDSADEELLSSGDANNLNHNQLLANASVKVLKPRWDESEGSPPVK